MALIVPARTSVSSRLLGRMRESLDADCLPCREAGKSGDAGFEAMSSRHVQAGALRGRKLHADADADADPKQQFHCSDRRVFDTTWQGRKAYSVLRALSSDSQLAVASPGLVQLEPLVWLFGR